MKNKRSAKILSLVLALIMAFSLVPVTASAEGTGADVNGGWWNQGWGGWQELPVEETVAPDETVSFPAAVLTSDAIDGLTVKVDAPEGTLPEGTEMTVTPVRLDAVQTAVDNTEGVSGTVLAAADITFLYEGKEIQPDGEITVTMTSAELANAENTSVVHLDASAAELESAEVEAEPVENVTLDAQSVTFDAAKFSVYAVVEGGETVTHLYTYNFVGGDGQPYNFVNQSGQMVSTQIIKNGESLQEVPTPGLYQNQAFVMWVYEGGELDGQEVKFGEENPITVGNEDKTFTVKAYYGSVIYITFWQYAAGKVVLERKQVAKNSDGKYVMNMTDVTVPAPKTTLKFMGWSLTPGSDASEENGDAIGSRPLLTNGNVEFTEDTDVYPVYYSGLWIVFVSADTGYGASYVDSYFLTGDSANASAAKPTDPTMKGYAFDGWYTEKEDPTAYSVADTGTAFDFNTSFNDLANYVNDRGEVVLYGHWKGGNTSYVVAYWYQNVTDSKAITQHSQKTYSYGGQTTPITSVNGQPVTTGSTLSPRSEDTNAAKAGVGYKYADYYDTVGGSTNVTAAPDGSTILNVYFDRKTIYMRFYNTNGSVDWYDNISAPVNYNANGWTGNGATTYTGLYGQTWAQAGYTTSWPSPGSGYLWFYYNDTYSNGNNTQGRYYNPFTGMSFLGEFVLPDGVYDSEMVEIRLFKASVNNYTISFILQNTDGTWPTTTSISGNGQRQATFYFSDKYEGFKVVGYRFGTSGSFTSVTAATASDGTHTYSPASVTLSGNMQIRYEREQYQIKFLNPLNNSDLFAAKTLAYEAPLSGARPTAAETASINLGQAGYEWDGRWYLDQACTVIALFGSNVQQELGDAYVSHNATDGTVVVSTNEGNKTFKYQVLGGMPLKGTKVYAGKEVQYFFIKMDPNGGQLQTGQATWRWVTYGDTSHITYKNIERNYIEYKGSGDAYYYYYDEFDTSKRQKIWDGDYMSANQRTSFYTSDPGSVTSMAARSGNGTYNGSAWLGSDKFSYEADAYALIGWYDITDGEANMKPFKDNTAITRDTILQAQWRRTGEYSVVYSVDAVDESGEPLMADDVRVQGWNSPVDSAKYADQSDSAIMDKMSGVPTGYNFVGWWYNGKMYQPGDVFKVLASIAVNKTVYIYPVLEPVESTPVPVIDLTYHVNGGKFTAAADTQLEEIIDALVAAEPGNRSTYNPTITTSDDGTAKTINNLKINEAFDILNAQAVERGIVLDNGQMVMGRGYRLAGWCTTEDGTTGTFFPVGTKIGVDDVHSDPNNGLPNDLYAVWDELVYVFHSATGEFEEVTVKTRGTAQAMPDRVKMTTDYDTANNVFTKYYYGGFGVYAAATKDADGLTFKNGSVSSGSIPATFWTRVNAAKSDTMWTDVGAKTGAVLYLREVSTSYLAEPQVVVIKDQWGKGPITRIQYLTVTDTNIFRAAGVVVSNENTKGTFAKSYTLIQNPNTEGTKETSQSLFNLDGYLSVVNSESLDTGSRTLRGYWITYDQVTVTAIDSSEKTIDIQ